MGEKTQPPPDAIPPAPPERKRFGLQEIVVTLTGEEWVAILGKLQGKLLSKPGQETYDRASANLSRQLVAASEKDRVAEPAKVLPEGIDRSEAKLTDVSDMPGSMARGAAFRRGITRE